MGKHKSFDTVSVSNIYYQSDDEQSDMPSQYGFLAEGSQGCDSVTMGILVRQFRYQLALQQKTIFRGRGRQQLQPTQQELLQITHAIKMNFPDKDTYRIIKLLFENLLPAGMFRVKKRIPNTKRVSEDEVRQALYKSNPISKIQRNIELVESLETYGGFKKVFLKSAYKPPNFTDQPGQQFRYRMKRCAATSFVKRGHSQQFFRQQVLSSGQATEIERGYYHPTLQAVVIETYKFLEQFIRNDCHLNIKSLVRQELKLFSNRLLHCRQTLKKNEVGVFLQLVKAVYGLDDSTIDEYQAVKLYLVTQRGLRLIMLKKIKEINEATNNRKDKSKSKEIQVQLMNDDAKSIIYEKTIQNRQAFDLKSMWTIKLQKQFLETYKKIQHFMDIKRYFKQKYPKNKHFFQGTGLKNRLNQILRASLRRVREIAAQNEGLITQLTKMDDNLIKYVLKSSRTLRSRLMLCDIYLDNCQVYTHRIEQVIKQLNEAIADKPYYKSQASSKSRDDSESMISSHPADDQNISHSWQDGSKQANSFWNQRVITMKRKTFYQQKVPKRPRGRRNKLFKQMYADEDKRRRERDPSVIDSVMSDPMEQPYQKRRQFDQDSDSPIRINMRPQQPEYYDNTFYYEDS